MSDGPRIIRRQYYKPYGEIAQQFNEIGYETDPSDMGYTGQRLDGESSLMYYGARYYDPRVELLCVG